jgi:hypothetical protein
VPELREAYPNPGLGGPPAKGLCQMKAHQRLVRERKAIEESNGLFGPWWESIDRDIKKAIVRPVRIETARSLVEEYEWLGCMPAVVWYCFGIFFEDACGGVVCFGPEYSENLGKQAREQGRKCADWSKYGYEGKMILLSRGVCLHWAHPHSGSKLISEAIKMLPPQYKVVTATVDDLAGEIGTIYQACNFVYVGSMRDSNPSVSSRKGDRDAWLINGKLYGTRAIRQKIGSVRQDDIKRYFPNAQRVRQNSKGRYFYFRGTKQEKAQDIDAIKHLIKPYPKRMG